MPLCCRWPLPPSHRQLMMLPADMALVWDKKFKAYVDLYAADEEAFFKVGTRHTRHASSRRAAATSTRSAPVRSRAADAPHARARAHAQRQPH